jgi:hypothetical protein
MYVETYLFRYGVLIRASKSPRPKPTGINDSAIQFGTHGTDIVCAQGPPGFTTNGFQEGGIGVDVPQ